MSANVCWGHSDDTTHEEAGDVSRKSEPEHDRQSVDSVPLQLSQVASQSVHVLFAPSANVCGGHDSASTQLRAERSRYDCTHDRQLVAVVPLQLAQVLWQSVHTLVAELAKVLAGHAVPVTQVWSADTKYRDPEQDKQLVDAAPSQLAQLSAHSVQMCVSACANVWAGQEVFTTQLLPSKYSSPEQDRHSVAEVPLQLAQVVSQSVHELLATLAKVLTGQSLLLTQR